VNRKWAAAHMPTLEKFLTAFNKGVAWFGDDLNRDEAISILAVTGNLKPEEVAKSYEFFRKGGFFEPTGSVSRAKLRAVTNVLVDLGDLPNGINIDQLLLPGVTKVID
jgi:ABC-type nitrate/sulfonate/bicarbonate transport system substrate-binding protein